MTAPAFVVPDFRDVQQLALGQAAGFARAERVFLERQGEGTSPAARRLARLEDELLEAFLGGVPLVPGSPAARYLEAAAQRAEDARRRMQFALCGPLRELLAFPGYPYPLPLDCEPISRAEAKRRLPALEGSDLLRDILHPVPGQKPPRPVAARPGVARAVPAAPARGPKKPRRPREPRSPRAPRSRRAPRVPRGPRRPRAARTPRTPRQRPKPKARLPECGYPCAWHYYCVRSLHENFKGVPSRCMRMHESQANAAIDAGYEVIETDECEECGGEGCSGPFAGLFTAVTRFLFGNPAQPAARRPFEAPSEVRRRRAQRRYALRQLLSNPPRLPEEQGGPPAVMAEGGAFYLVSSPKFPQIPPNRLWLLPAQRDAAIAGGYTVTGPVP